MILDRRVVPFKRWHYDWLVGRGPHAERDVLVLVNGMVLDTLERANSWTAVVDGDPVACAGTLQQWPGRHLAWAYITRGTLPLMSWITDEVQRNLAGVKGRIELTVRKDFPVGQRWARTLGFEVETPLLRAFGPEGEPHVGYVRFN